MNLSPEGMWLSKCLTLYTNIIYTVSSSVLHSKTYLSKLQPEIDCLFQIISNHQTFLLVGHSNPDGDCMGSMLGLGSWLKNIWKKVSYVASRVHDKSLDRVPWSEQIQYFVDNKYFGLEETQVVMFLDHNWSRQRSDMETVMTEYIRNRITVCIDHHMEPTLETDCNIIDESSSSCCELIREMLSDRETRGNTKHIDPYIATMLYLGLTTDTGGSVGLEYEKDSIRSYENALGMLKHGADKQTIIRQLNTISLPTLQFTITLLQRTRYSKHCIRTRSTKEEIEELRLDGNKAWVAKRLLRQVTGFDVFAKFTLVEWVLYASLRTSNQTDVQRIAAHFGWGWHIYAAGFKLYDKKYTIDDIEAIVVKIDQLVEQ